MIIVASFPHNIRLALADKIRFVVAIADLISIATMRIACLMEGVSPCT